MNDNEWSRKNLEEDPSELDEVDHETVNFVDNLNSVFSLNNPEDAEIYIDRFIYTSELDTNTKNIKELVYAADKYQISGQTSHQAMNSGKFIFCQMPRYF